MAAQLKRKCCYNTGAGGEGPIDINEDWERIGDYLQNRFLGSRLYIEHRIIGLWWFV